MTSSKDSTAMAQDETATGKAPAASTKPSAPSVLDPELQAQVDAQLLEQGAFSPLDWLIDSGRLIYADYESWRRREIEFLDSVLMGNRERILGQITMATQYARGIGLIEEAQEFHSWDTDGRDSSARPLRISADPNLHRLIGSRYAPRQDAPQMDLFFDNPVVALANGTVRALCSRNVSEAQRQLDRLYAQSPNHADLPAFDRLLAALGHLNQPIADPGEELDFLLNITPTAKRLLHSQARDLLAPLWRHLADAIEGQGFSSNTPELHRSFALTQAQDWAAVADSVLAEAKWWRHPVLCLRLAQSAFYRQRRIEALTAWCHLCWQAPNQAAEALETHRQPDSGMTVLWQKFSDFEEEDARSGVGGLSEPVLTAADFPAWLLLHEPALVQQLTEELPNGDSPGEQRYRCAHRWVQARRAGQGAGEIEMRKALQASHPALFRYLKKRV